MKKVSWFLVLFALPFLGVGLWMGYMAVESINKVEAARSWNEAPAEISSCVLERHRGKKGSVSYSLRADYTYTVDGRKHRSTKVCFYTGSDNIGDFHRRTFYQLEAARLGKKTFPCWVNPKNPDEVVLIRDLRPEMMGFQLIFFFVFGGAAFAVLSAAAFSLGARQKDNVRIRMRNSWIHRPLLLAGIVTGGSAVWLLWKAIMLTGNFASVWYLGIALIPGVILLGVGLYLWRRFAKFGVSELMLSPTIIRVGETVNATVAIPRLIEGDFKGVFSCTHQYTTGSGKHRTTHHVKVWSEEQTSSGSPGGESATQARFRFDIRAGHVTEDRGNESYYWRLLVTSDLPGVDYKAEFDVIVV
jgi:Protein of unknown function (DUF3592)